jgi:hypothetical protein
MTTTKAINEFAAAEQMLRDAGFTFSVVEACTHAACEICVAAPVPAAA